jgi:hypothetical protein
MITSLISLGMKIFMSILRSGANKMVTLRATAVMGWHAKRVSLYIIFNDLNLRKRWLAWSREYGVLLRMGLSVPLRKFTPET